MARLKEGDNPHIDNINRLVWLAKYGSAMESSDAIGELLEIFKPMMLNACKKWSNHFSSAPSHKIMTINELMGECVYWFSYYTIDKYIIDGRATYNKFITDHINQRVRYILETEMKYHNKHISPTPFDGQSDSEAFDEIVNGYAQISTGDTVDMEQSMELLYTDNSKNLLAKHIMDMLECATFNDRERDIFTKIVIQGVTHEKLGEEYGISRTRITQILAKVKAKLYKKIEADPQIWDMLDDADIDITNPKLME